MSYINYLYIIKKKENSNVKFSRLVTAGSNTAAATKQIYLLMEENVLGHLLTTVFHSALSAGGQSMVFGHLNSITSTLNPLLAKLWSFLSIICQELFLETTDYGRPMKLFYI